MWKACLCLVGAAVALVVIVIGNLWFFPSSASTDPKLVIVFNVSLGVGVLACVVGFIVSCRRHQCQQRQVEQHCNADAFCVQSIPRHFYNHHCHHEEDPLCNGSDPDDVIYYIDDPATPTSTEVYPNPSAPPPPSPIKGI